MSASRGDRPSADPFRTSPWLRESPPSVEEVARGVLEKPVVIGEILRLLAWIEPETLQMLKAACEAAQAHREDVLERVAAGTFARDHYNL